MKLKVIGWANYDDMRYEDGDCDYASRLAIVDEIREKGYVFSGYQHQEAWAGAPILSDGKRRCYSQRGWGGVMAEACGYDAPMDYVYYAFSVDDEEKKLPPDEELLSSKIYDACKELLTAEELHDLYEEDFSIRYPHPELGEKGIYVLTAEECQTCSAFDIVKQIPYAVYQQFFGKDLRDTYHLDEKDCQITDEYIQVKLQETFKLIAEGDTVVIGEKSYEVTEVEPFVDVSKEVDSAVLSRADPNFEQAMQEYRNAGVTVKIYFKK